MKIGITGTHGVGKTSLSHSLVGTLKEMGVHAVVSAEHERRCPFPVGTENQNSIDAQTWIIMSQFLEELELCKSYPVLVCDRTMICNYSYFLWNLKQIPEKEKSHPKIKAVHDLVDNWVKTYDYLFKIPIVSQTTLMDDGFRSTTTEWQKEIDNLIDKIIKEKSLQYRTIPLDTNSKRVKKVLDLIGIDKLKGLHKK